MLLKFRRPNILQLNILANKATIHFIVKHFDELSSKEVYELLLLREEVFQLEQNCLYKDIDGKDIYCYHVLLYVNEELAAYTRIVPEGISYRDFVSIGRVVSSTKWRNEGMGRNVMQKTMEVMEELFPEQDIKISAQAYLQKFYEDFGFVKISEPYLEDDIPHIAMVYKK